MRRGVTAPPSSCSPKKKTSSMTEGGWQRRSKRGSQPKEGANPKREPAQKETGRHALTAGGDHMYKSQLYIHSSLVSTAYIPCLGALCFVGYDGRVATLMLAALLYLGRCLRANQPALCSLARLVLVGVAPAWVVSFVPRLHLMHRYYTTLVAPSLFLHFPWQLCPPARPLALAPNVSTVQQTGQVGRYESAS